MITRRIKISSIIIFAFISSCNSKQSNIDEHNIGNSIIVLGTAQDAGSPHINCRKDCCIDLWHNPQLQTNVVSIALYDNALKHFWLLEATPDIALQLNKIKELTENNDILPSGVLLTHAHIGHYTGLMHFGREAMGAQKIPVYCLPRMKSYLEENGPWSQLVELNNITLNELQPDSGYALSENLIVKPVTVPHRDEFSETAAYYLEFYGITILFIPDIDKWDKWDKNIIEEIKKVDIAFLDATFYDNDELPNRDMAEIPHPFVVESMQLFDKLDTKQKNKIYFIHFNHSNPLLKKKSKQFNAVVQSGYHVTQQYDIIPVN